MGSESYLKYRKNVIESYASWNIGLGNGSRSLLEAGKCVENILKATVINTVKDYDVKVFDEPTYSKLQELGYFKNPLKGITFGIGHCLYILKGRYSQYKSIEEYSLSIMTINQAYNNEKHGQIKETDPDAKQVYERLYFLINWFFNNEGEPDWEAKFIKPKMEESIKDFRNDFASKAADLISANIKKDLNELKSEKSNNEKSFFNHKYLASGIFILLLLVSIISLVYKRNSLEQQSSLQEENPYFNESQNTYNVVLFPFEPFEKCKFKKTKIESTIKNRLMEMSARDGLNLQVIFDTTHCIHSYEEADSIGKVLNASLVIWGDLYEHCNSNNEACIRFTNISSEYLLNQVGKGKTEITSISSLSEIYHGKLLKEIDYIIYWIAATKEMFNANYKRAISLYKKLEKGEATTSNVLGSMGDCYFLLNNLDSAKYYFEELLRKSPENAQANEKYAEVLSKMKKNTQLAKKHFEIALKLDTSNFMANFNFAQFLWETEHNLEGVRFYFAKASKYGPNLAFIKKQIADFLLFKCNDTIGALPFYILAAEINPNNADYQHSVGVIWLSINQYDEAKYYFERALAIDSTSTKRNLVFAEFLNKAYKDYKKANFYLKKAMYLDPKNDVAVCWYAENLLKLEENAEAKTYLNLALKLNPKNAYAHGNYCNLLLKLNDTINAKLHYMAAVRLDPEFKTDKSDKLFHLKN